MVGGRVGTLAAASAEKEYCVLAMQMGSPAKPILVYSSICCSAWGRYSTLAAPYVSLAIASIFSCVMRLVRQPHVLAGHSVCSNLYAGVTLAWSSIWSLSVAGKALGWLHHMNPWQGHPSCPARGHCEAELGACHFARLAPLPTPGPVGAPRCSALQNRRPVPHVVTLAATLVHDSGSQPAS